MSKIKYTDDNKVTERKGEFFTAASCYTTPRSLAESAKEYPHDDPDGIMGNLIGDVDELQNKPRRFFDHLLSIVEYKRAHDPDIDNHREYWQHLVKGCEEWLSAVNNGLYGEVKVYAQKEGGTEPYTWNDLVQDLVDEAEPDPSKRPFLGDASPQHVRNFLTKRGVLKKEV